MERILGRAFERVDATRGGWQCARFQGGGKATVRVSKGSKGA